ncbi:putative disease resistance protein RGA4 isoform X2 [Oryza glaberrima]|uniref:putative disease resistance protein RGA4 isoform X2 n=1 Tax=Oryza glaberrima TaxID=4538 RepID=UPI00224C35AF|nr:putative disease resistance protein RGA4 isoform X2 [Oryza glaberrima]
MGMEAAVVSGLFKIVGDKLAPLVIREYSSLMGVTKDLQELQDLVEEIKSGLQVAGDNAIGNKPPSNWLKKLKDFAYDLEDLVHEFHLQSEKHDTDNDRDKYAVLKYMRTKPKLVMFQLKMVNKIKTIKKRFAAIVEQRGDVNTILNAMPIDHNVHTNKIIREPSLLGNVDDSKIHVRDEQKHKIICKLIDDQQKISIVSIIGLGGTGKTTMATHICHDNKIKEHFEGSIFWVHVSQEFDNNKLVGKLYEAIFKETSYLRTDQHMVEAISNKLNGNKFLLVLDDAWHKNQYDWERFMLYLKRGSPGSRILLTTRDQEVAEAVESICTYKLAFLSDEDSWNLFQQSLRLAAKGLPSEFIEVGREIIKKCGGVPLAIKTLAGVLRNKKTIDAWCALRDSNMWNVDDIEDRVFASLRLSYFHLPDHLKQCFVYCSIFPKGYEIYKHQLIGEWIANGFINPMNEIEQVEDVANDCFDSLLKVHFLQDLEVDEYNEMEICKMHDLVHDLTRQILQGEMVSHSQNATIGNSQKCRYLSLASCNENIEVKLFSKVHAVYISGDNFAPNKPIKKRCRALPEEISRCWNLQALHVTHCKALTTLPESIGKLRKLRTLELSHVWDLESLPQSIGDCHNLQSFLLRYSNIREIPNSICKIKKLRVLNIMYCLCLRQQWSEFFGTFCNLQSINLARIDGTHNLFSSFACHKLRTLTLCETEITRLPQCLTVVSTLEYIDLQNCRGLLELSEGIGNLERLEVLNLKGCSKLGGLPVGIGQLTHLQRLHLFVIGGSCEHARITELRNLNLLTDNDLEIKNIKYVEDPDDAEKTSLKERSCILNLTLDWSSNGAEGCSDSMEDEPLLDMEKELRVLNGLEPPSQIKKLNIYNYKGKHFSRWMMKQRESSCSDSLLEQIDPPHFTQLTELVLEQFPNLENLQGLARLPSLKTFVLKGMPNLVELWTISPALVSGEEGKLYRIDHEQVEHCFPFLSTLIISDCPKLKVCPCFPPYLDSLTLERSNEQLLSQVSFSRPLHPLDKESSSICFSVDPPHLKKLKLGGMSGSSSGWEVLQNLTGLESLSIYSSDVRQLGESIRSLTSLQYLCISGCPVLAMLPEWLGCLRSLQTLVLEEIPLLASLPKSIMLLTSLEKLIIFECDNLKELPEVVHHPTSLKKLIISSCRNLSQLPEGIQHLTNLEYLNIQYCLALHKLPEGLGMLGSLEHLTIEFLPGLTTLPESMQGLTSLQHINLLRCPMLTVLPESLGQLSALQSLFIQNCPGLQSLPSSIQHLTSLQHLLISYNPTLSRHYKNKVGKDWHIISHIPDVEIKD